MDVTALSQNCREEVGVVEFGLYLHVQGGRSHAMSLAANVRPAELALSEHFLVVLVFQGGAIAVKVALENADIFAGLVLLAPAIILCPRWLSTSAPAVSVKCSARIAGGGRLGRLNPLAH